MVDACEAWCRNFAANGRAERAIVISGPFGCGKTSALNSSRCYVKDVRMAIWPEPWIRPPNYIYVNWADFVRDVSENDNRAAMEDVTDADVVFIDDMGSEEDRFKSGSATRITGDVLGKLHDGRKFVFITTNIAPDGWKARWDGRVEDRLFRMNANMVNLWSEQGESYAAWKAKSWQD